MLEKTINSSILKEAVKYKNIGNGEFILNIFEVRFSVKTGCVLLEKGSKVKDFASSAGDMESGPVVLTTSPEETTETKVSLSKKGDLCCPNLKRKSFFIGEKVKCALMQGVKCPKQKIIEKLKEQKALTNEDQG